MSALGVGFGTWSARDAIAVPAFPLRLPDRGGLGGSGNSRDKKVSKFSKFSVSYGSDWSVPCVSIQLTLSQIQERSRFKGFLGNELFVTVHDRTSEASPVMNE